MSEQVAHKELWWGSVLYVYCVSVWTLVMCKQEMKWSSDIVEINQISSKHRKRHKTAVQVNTITLPSVYTHLYIHINTPSAQKEWILYEPCPYTEKQTTTLNTFLKINDETIPNTSVYECMNTPKYRLLTTVNSTFPRTSSLLKNLLWNRKVLWM